MKRRQMPKQVPELGASGSDKSMSKRHRPRDRRSLGCVDLADVAAQMRPGWSLIQAASIVFSHPRFSGGAERLVPAAYPA
jgi:hypothetical protein